MCSPMQPRIRSNRSEGFRHDAPPPIPRTRCRASPHAARARRGGASPRRVGIGAIRIADSDAESNRGHRSTRRRFPPIATGISRVSPAALPRPPGRRSISRGACFRATLGRSSTRAWSCGSATCTAATTTPATTARRATTISRATASLRRTRAAVTRSRRYDRFVTPPERRTCTCGCGLPADAPLTTQIYIAGDSADGDFVLAGTSAEARKQLTMVLAPAASGETGALAGMFDFVIR